MTHWHTNLGFDRTYLNEGWGGGSGRVAAYLFVNKRCDWLLETIKDNRTIEM